MHSSIGNQFRVMSKTPKVHDLFGVNNNKKKRHTPIKSKFVKKTALIGTRPQLLLLPATISTIAGRGEKMTHA